MIISERIFQLLAERQMSQLEFSKATGISQGAISDWKRKKTNPSADKIMIICKTLDVSPYELLQDSDDDSKDGMDYIIISENTQKYDLVVEFDKLNSKYKERLFGYLNALVDLSDDNE